MAMPRETAPSREARHGAMTVLHNNRMQANEVGAMASCSAPPSQLIRGVRRITRGVTGGVVHKGKEHEDA